MNFLLKPLVAATAMTALVSVCAPAQAFSFLSATSNTDGSFSFAKKTTVQFDFFASHGAFQSKFGVYSAAKDDSLLETLFTEVQARDPLPGKKPDYNKNDSKGTCGITVLPVPCQATFTFAKGASYFLGLTSKDVGKDKATVFTDAKETSFNFVSGDEKFVYYTNYKHNQPLTKRTSQVLSVDPGTTLIGVNDSWSGDKDYNDFIVKARVAESVPEPGAIGALLGVSALGFMGRRRKAGQAAKV